MAFEITSANPFAIIIIANVAINGGIFNFAIAAPEIKPTTAPIKIPPSTATQTGKPKLTANTPVITEDKVSTVPQDKSIPLVTIIIVAPKARMPVTAVDKKMPIILSNCRKLAEAIEKNDNKYN